MSYVRHSPSPQLSSVRLFLSNGPYGWAVTRGGSWRGLLGAKCVCLDRHRPNTDRQHHSVITGLLVRPSWKRVTCAANQLSSDGSSMSSEICICLAEPKSVGILEDPEIGV